MRLFILRAVRRVLKGLEQLIDQEHQRVSPVAGVSNGRETDVQRFLDRVDFESDAGRAYFAMHSHRILKTLSLVPPNGGRALELGSYLYSAAVLDRVLGYRDVHTAYYHSTLGRDQKSLRIQGQPDFVCDVDLFDAEQHVFPYSDACFDLVLCCEIVEHLIRDPMHLLFECHRILVDGGLLVLTTPNAASLTSVGLALHGRKNPQVFSSYPAAGNSGDTPHVREYTAGELSEAVKSAGFEIETLFTERFSGFDEGSWVRALLEREGFDTSLRGEQTYCLARKRSNVTRDRYPNWLYAG